MTERSALTEILDRIERREVADGFLQQCLENGDEPTRAWAARGLGASRHPDAIAPLLDALSDESTWVRSAALFALPGPGPASDPLPPNSAAARRNALREHLKSSEPVLRYLSAQGLGRIPRANQDSDREIRDELIEALVDPAPTVRQAAAIALVERLPTRSESANTSESENRAEGRRQLTDVLTRTLAIERDADVRWHLVYALQRIDHPDAVRTLRTRAVTAGAGRWERLFAIRGLSGSAVRSDRRRDPASVHALCACARDSDAVLALEAAQGLARHLDAEKPIGAPELVRTLRDLVRHDSAHVRAVAVRALGRSPNDEPAILATYREDPSPMVRAAALEALARAEQPDAAGRHAVLDALRDREIDWRVQLGAVRGLAHLPPEVVTPWLAETRESADRTLDPRIVLAVLAALPTVAEDRARAERSPTESDSPESKPANLASTRPETPSDTPTDDHVADLAVRWAVARLRAAPDPARFEAAADALASIGAPRASPAVPDLVTAWRAGLSATGSVEANPDPERAEDTATRTWTFASARQQLARAIATLAPDHRALQEIADRDPVELVRAATDRTPTAPPPTADRGGPRVGAGFGPNEIATGFLFAKPRPRIRLDTARGPVVIELLPELAPVHCYNLLQLVGRGAYDGRTFHRVVPNFVVQGGDARGDGFGNTAWFGGPLRDELNPLPFLAGRVGMPRTADPDTGGDQLFITTVPTPRLDGRYTAFGRVVEGMAIVRQLEPGDVIRTVKSEH